MQIVETGKKNDDGKMSDQLVKGRMRHTIDPVSRYLTAIGIIGVMYETEPGKFTPVITFNNGRAEV